MRSPPQQSVSPRAAMIEGLLCAREGFGCFPYRLLLTTALASRVSHPHFIDVETEAQR